MKEATIDPNLQQPGGTVDRTGTIENALKSASNGRVHFRVQVQRTRAATYLLASAIGIIFKKLGALDITYLEILYLISAAVITSIVFAAMARTRIADRIQPFFDPLWMSADVLLISYAVQITGGASSPWFPWYLANIAGAAFVIGQFAAFIVAIADTIAYVIVLQRMGDITAIDIELFTALARMAFLYGASYLFLRGVSILKDKQMCIKVIRDDARRKVEELTRLTSMLDERTRELEDANLRIKEADRMKSQFLANMSHELRTPLNSIIGFSDVLITRMPEDTPPRFDRFLENIHSSGQHLLGIINDLLDLSKIEAGKMELCLEPVELALVVQGVCSIMHGSARDRSIGFDIQLEPDLPAIEADPVKIKQILFNLVSNAVKFSNEGTNIGIVTERTKDEDGVGDAVRIKIIDHGVGIDPCNHRVIFEEFRQVDGSSTRSFGGTGLGLALVRRLVELHGGSIAVESAIGEGSTFTLTLPVRFLADSSAPIEFTTNALDLPYEEGQRILVVEDDPTAYEVLRSHLSKAGFVPVRARNSREALDFVYKIKPAAITLDIILPGPDGWEIMRQLKDDPDTAAIPIIMVSVLDNRDLAITLGAADYLIKPIDGDELVQRLATLVPLPGKASPRLLLIDDDPVLHDLVEAKLVLLGYTIAHAMNGKDGLATAAHHKPELIILDLMMEEMDGFEVAEKLKSGSETAQIPVIVLTAKEIDRHDHERLQGRIEALVEKVEISGDRFINVIEEALKEGLREN